MVPCTDLLVSGAEDQMCRIWDGRKATREATKCALDKPGHFVAKRLISLETGVYFGPY